jgi:hypothetical protein
MNIIDFITDLGVQGFTAAAAVASVAFLDRVHRSATHPTADLYIYYYFPVSFLCANPVMGLPPLALMMQSEILLLPPLTRPCSGVQCRPAFQRAI